jgi:hypothetical protein
MAEDKKFTKEELDAAIEEAVGKVQASVEKLEAKNEELVGDLRKARQEARKAKDIDPAEVDRLEREVEELKGNLTTAEKAAKDATTKAEKAEKALETETGFTSKLLIQDGLKSALIANGVKDEDMIDVLVAKFASGAKVTTEGEERKATIGDKPLADHIKEWAASDAGKKYVAAAVNSGGGAGGGDKTKVEAATMTRSAYDGLSQQEKSELGPKMVKGELKLVDDAA